MRLKCLIFIQVYDTDRKKTIFRTCEKTVERNSMFCQGQGHVPADMLIEEKNTMMSELVSLRECLTFSTQTIICQTV